MATPYAGQVKYVMLGTDTYEIAGRYLIDSNGGTHTYEDLVNNLSLPIVVQASLPTASASTMGKLYLIPVSGSGQNVKEEYITWLDGSTYKWEMIGTTQADLSNYATLDHTHTVTPESIKLSATASGGAVSASGTDTFVKSYPGATSKMVTTSIKGVAGTTSVATVSSAGSNGSAASWGASVDSNGVLSFAWTANTPTTVPTFGSATVATANANATTVATGSLDAGGSGASVMTGLGTATTASAVTGVSMTAQPTIRLSSGATGDVTVAAATAISTSTAVENPM